MRKYKKYKRGDRYMSVKERLIEVLSTFGHPVFLQGTLAENEQYPTSFFTFWNNSTDGAAFYDDDCTVFEWDLDVNFYSEDPELVNSVLVQARKKLKEAGFIVRGKGHDIASDEITHTGRGLDVYYMEKNTDEQGVNKNE